MGNILHELPLGSKRFIKTGDHLIKRFRERLYFVFGARDDEAQFQIFRRDLMDGFNHLIKGPERQLD